MNLFERGRTCLLSTLFVMLLGLGGAPACDGDGKEECEKCTSPDWGLIENGGICFTLSG